MIYLVPRFLSGYFFFFSEPFGLFDKLIYGMNSLLFFIERKIIMKDKLQNVFKEPPERFTSTIESALSEARNKSKTRRFNGAAR